MGALTGHRCQISSAARQSFCLFACAYVEASVHDRKARSSSGPRCGETFVVDAPARRSADASSQLNIPTIRCRAATRSSSPGGSFTLRDLAV
jgi:hypothetical protein